MVMQDFATNKNFYRKKVLVDRALYALGFHSLGDKEKDELELIFQKSAWGKKMKEKFINKLRESDNLDDERFEYLFG
jgi:hypothetical protein